MEDAIQNAEKLVHATNTALAQMKFNMDFESLPKNPDGESNVFLEKIRHNRRKKKDQFLPIQEELEKFENEVRSDTNDLLSSMDDLLNPEHYLSARKTVQQSKIDEKIQEINNQIECRRKKLSEKVVETDIVKPRLSQRIQFDNKEFKEQIKEIPEKLATTPTIADSDKSSRTSLNRTFTIAKPKKVKVTENLKKQILQTEEVVNRGFETVRQLNQKLDKLKKHDRKVDRVPSFDKISFSSKSQTHFSPKSVSTETVKSCDCKKSRGTKKKAKRENKMENVSVMDVKWSECGKHHGKKLKFQRLPSLHIRNCLKLQKIPSVDILPQEKEEACLKNNVVLKNLVYNENEGNNLERLYGELYDQRKKEKLIECIHCGKYIRIFENNIRSSDIDDLLLKCNFNVFDPRIDEFAKEAYEDNHQCKKDVLFENKISSKSNVITDVEIESINKKKFEKRQENQVEGYETDRNIGKVEEKDFRSEETENKIPVPVTVSQLGEESSRKCKEKTMKIESDFLEFENIIRDIFKKVDESRAVFEGTKYFSTIEKPTAAKNEKQLLMTKPVVLELKKSDDATNIVAKKASVKDKKYKTEKELVIKSQEFNYQKEKEVLKESGKTEIEKELRKNEELNNKKKKEEMLLQQDRETEIKKTVRKYEKLNSRKNQKENQIKANISPISPENSFCSKESSVSSTSSISAPEEKNRVNDLTLLSKPNKVDIQNTPFLPTSPKFIPSELWKPPVLNKTSEIATGDLSSVKDSKRETSSSSDRAKLEENSNSSFKKNDIQTDENYQSDFEVESLDNSFELPLENEINIPAIDLSSLEPKKITSNINRLPTISEKDSEGGKKTSSSTISEIMSENLDDRKSKEVVKNLQRVKEVSLQVAEDENDNKTELQAEKIFYRKVDEDLKEVLNEAFEKGASYMLKRQRNILSLNYKAARRKSISKKSRNLKVPDVEESSLSSPSDKIEKSKENNRLNSHGSSSHIQQAACINKHQITQVNLEKQENIPKEMFASMKELLDALRTQFEKTEVLTEKLTENVQSKKDEKQESPAVVNSVNPLENLKYVNNIIFNNLEQNQKDFTIDRHRLKSRNIFTQRNEEIKSDFGNPRFLNLSHKNLDNIRLETPFFDSRQKDVISPASNFSHSSREDRSLSFGEIAGNSFLRKKDDMGAKKIQGKIFSQNNSATNSNSDKFCKSSPLSRRKIDGKHVVSPKSSLKECHASDSISEGEVPSIGLIDDKYDSGQSIGEVISEHILSNSLEDNGIKF